MYDNCIIDNNAIAYKTSEITNSLEKITDYSDINDNETIDEIVDLVSNYYYCIA